MHATLLIWQDNFFCRFCMLQLALVKTFNILNRLLLSNYYHKSNINTLVILNQSPCHL